jgi:Tol biopolymer transport system component
MKRCRRHLWLSLAFGICVVLQGCAGFPGLPGDGNQFRPIPSTGGSGTPLAVNLDDRFQGHIAFVRNHQLYVLSGKDGTIRALPAAGNNVQDPAYAPDGSRLAYVSRGDAWSDLMIIPASGGAPVALTRNRGTGRQITCPGGVSETDSVWVADPVWTPDGKTLYYLSDAQKLALSCGFLDMAIWKMPARGGAPELVVWPARGNGTGDPGAGGDADLSLRPGADAALTYTHYAYDPQNSGERLIQIFLAALNQQRGVIQQEETVLTPATGADGTTPLQALQASWSPDGHELAYIIQANGSESLVVMHVSDPASGAPDFSDYATSTRLLEGAISYPIWSPDGKSLLYMDFKYNEFNLYLVQLAFNGTTVSVQAGPTQLTQGGVDGDSHPSWTSA